MVRTEVIGWLKSIKEKYIHGGDDFYDHQRRTAIDYAVGFLEGQKPMTNADRIRNMSDEELAKHFSGLICDINEGVEYHEAQSRWLEWLKQPAEVE